MTRMRSTSRWYPPDGWVMIGQRSYVRLEDIRRVYPGKPKLGETRERTWILVHVSNAHEPKAVECGVGVATVLARMKACKQRMDNPDGVELR